MDSACSRTSTITRSSHQLRWNAPSPGGAAPTWSKARDPKWPGSRVDVQLSVRSAHSVAPQTRSRRNSRAAASPSARIVGVRVPRIAPQRIAPLLFGGESLGYQGRDGRDQECCDPLLHAMVGLLLLIIAARERPSSGPPTVVRRGPLFASSSDAPTPFPGRQNLPGSPLVGLSWVELPLRRQLCSSSMSFLKASRARSTFF